MNVNRIFKTIKNSVLDINNNAICEGDVVIFCGEKIKNHGYPCRRGIVEKINPVTGKIYINGKWLFPDTVYSIMEYIKNDEKKNAEEYMEKKKEQEMENRKNAMLSAVDMKMILFIMQSGKEAFMEYFYISSNPGKKLSAGMIKNAFLEKKNKLKEQFDNVCVLTADPKGWEMSKKINIENADNVSGHYIFSKNSCKKYSEILSNPSKTGNILKYMVGEEAAENLLNYTEKNIYVDKNHVRKRLNDHERISYFTDADNPSNIYDFDKICVNSYHWNTFSDVFMDKFYIMYENNLLS